MCDPLSIVSAGLSVAGMIAQQQGNQQATDARNNATAWENAQQKTIQREAQDAFNNTESKFSPKSQTDQQSAYADTRSNAINAATSPPVDTSAGQRKGGPAVVGNAINGAIGNTNAIAAGEGNALAKQGSLSDLFTGNKIAINQGSDVQNKLTSFSAGDENLLPLMLMDANQQGAGLRSFGGLLSLGGSLAGLGAKSPNAPTSFGSFLPDTTGDNWWTKMFGRSVPQQVA